MSTTTKKATVVSPAKKTPAKKAVAKKTTATKSDVEKQDKPQRVLYRWECVLDGCERHGRWVRAEDGGRAFGLNHVKIRTKRGQVGHDVRVVDNGGNTSSKQ